MIVIRPAEVADLPAILAIYIDARDNYAGVNNDSVISDAVKARRDLREAEFMASSLLASFDAED